GWRARRPTIGETDVPYDRRASMADTRAGNGRTALVTGASMGIGVDLAECFAADGYDVVLTARSEPALRALAERLAKEHRVQATAIAADLAQAGGGAAGAAARRRRAAPHHPRLDHHRPWGR